MSISLAVRRHGGASAGGRARRSFATSVSRVAVRPHADARFSGWTTEAAGGARAASLPSFVKIVEVGPRDGLQNEKKSVDTAVKIEFIDRLSRSGLSYIEATSFVSKKWVPQMGDATEVMRGIARADRVTYAALTPNVRGLESAIEVGVREVAIFAAASDAFSMRNINCSVLESFERFKPLMEVARANNVRVRGYVSCVLGCPYQGAIAPDAVGFVAQSLLEMGCYEISLGDTIGVGTPLTTSVMLQAVRQHIPLSAIAVHFHSTFGSAMANILVAIERGVSVIDSSVAGLGGCPYAKGASGNVATEDVVYMLHGMGVATRCDLDALVETGQWMCDYLGRPNMSKAAVARLAAKAALGDAAALQREGKPAAAAAIDESVKIALCWPSCSTASAAASAAAAPLSSAAAPAAAPPPLPPSGGGPGSAALGALAPTADSPPQSTAALYAATSGRSSG